MSLDAQPAAAGQGGLRLRRPLMVKNLEGNATTFAKVVNGNALNLRWTAKGHPGDTQRVPYDIVEDTDFLNSLEQGIFEVVDGEPEYVEFLRRETSAVRDRREQEAAKATDMLDRRQDKDMVGVSCIGPAPAGREGECGKALVQSAKAAAEQPPLCSLHSNLSHQFFLAEAGSKGEGATETRDGVVRREWRKVQMTGRQTQQ